MIYEVKTKAQTLYLLESSKFVNIVPSQIL